MSEKLKTLKDFKEVECGDYLPHRCEGREFLKEELREEATKWIVKLTQEHHGLTDGYETTLERYWEANRGCSVSDDGSICDICHTLRWITHFFDLEEGE